VFGFTSNLPGSLGGQPPGLSRRTVTRNVYFIDLGHRRATCSSRSASPTPWCSNSSSWPLLPAERSPGHAARPVRDWQRRVHRHVRHDERQYVLPREWQSTGELLSYQDIAVVLGLYGLPKLPEGLDLGLKSATFQFDSRGPLVHIPAGILQLRPGGAGGGQERDRRLRPSSSGWSPDVSSRWISRTST